MTEDNPKITTPRPIRRHRRKEIAQMTDKITGASSRKRKLYGLIKDIKELKDRFSQATKDSSRLRYVKQLLCKYVKVLHLGHFSPIPVNELPSPREERIAAWERGERYIERYQYADHTEFFKEMQNMVGTIERVYDRAKGNSDDKNGHKASDFNANLKSVGELLKEVRALLRAEIGDSFTHYFNSPDSKGKESISKEIYSISPIDYSLCSTEYYPRSGRKALHQWLDTLVNLCFACTQSPFMQNGLVALREQVEMCINNLSRKEISVVKRFLDSAILLQNAFFVCQYNFCANKLHSCNPGVSPRQYPDSSPLYGRSASNVIIMDVWSLCRQHLGRVKEADLRPYVAAYYKDKEYSFELCQKLLRNVRQFAMRHNLPLWGQKLSIERSKAE